ncbi:universal stress protein [Halobaculum litoreum]|uniref:Universal stress protein n=1 Tax=Halobaculum litoreum TaxID=3031998 RepID=A0ABD5XVY4_9EURY|nr:universal stress protein [Halobaculum sp. DT92]
MRAFSHLAVPVANADDAVATVDALGPHLRHVDRITLVHVIEKGGGVVDKAPMAKRRADAEAFLAVAAARIDGTVPTGTRIAFGTDVAETIVKTAIDVGATAVAFHPRGGSRLLRLLTGDTATRLVSDPDLPIVSLPPTDDGTGPDPSPAGRREVDS